MTQTTFRAIMKWINLAVALLIILLATRYLWSRAISEQLGGMHDVTLVGLSLFCVFFGVLTVKSIRRGRGSACRLTSIDLLIATPYNSLLGRNSSVGRAAHS